MVSLAYPLGDVVLLSLVLLVLSRAGPALRRTLVWIGAAILALTFADVGYWYLNAESAYQTGSYTDAGWIVAFLLLGYASLRPVAAPQEQEAPPGLALTVIPLLPFFVGVATAVAEEVRAGGLEPILFWTALGLVVVLLTRQFLIVLENIQLRRWAQQALERALDTQSQRTLMLNTVTHDLMSPLSAVRIQLHLLGSRKDFDEKASRSLHIVDRNIDAVGRLARDLKDLANLEAGQLKLMVEDVDLAAIVRQAGDSFRDAAELAGLRLDVQAEAEIRVRGDRHRLDQLLYNLVSNAIRYTKTGGITVGAHRRGGLAVVWVRDSGRGLDAEEIARLFKPFIQVHAAGEARDKGTGLGLYISRSIADAHHGALRVESPGLGKGSTFLFEMPLNPTDPSAAAAPLPTPPSAPD